MRFLVLCLLLAGCGDLADYVSNDLPDDDDFPGWSGNSVERNDQFKLNYDPNKINGPIMGAIERVWLEVQTCIGVSLPNPGLIIEYTRGSKIPDPYDGYIVYRDHYIRIHQDDWGFHYLLRHHFIHWALWMLGTSRFDLDNHNSPYYDRC